MRIHFPHYPNVAPVDVPDSNLIGVYEPETAEAASDPVSMIRDAFAEPIGCAPIREMARGCSNALVICDDNTRRTPVREILSALLPELETAGIARDKVTVLVALGTHRRMSGVEMLAKFGEEYLRTLRIVSHEWRNEDQLVDLGVTKAGTPIQVNKAVQEADFIFGIGQIVPHRIAGFSGGGKIIQPGICGAETTAQTHWRSALYAGAEILGVADNPVRLEIETVAARVGLRAIANAVCDPDGRLIGMFVGHPVAAHRAGAELSKRVYGFHIPEQADILIIDSYPMDNELWQGAKALYAGELAVKRGGAAILVSPCPEGVSQTHSLILEEGYRRSWETISLVENGFITDKIVAAHLVRVGRVIRDEGAGILVSEGISREDTEKLGFIYASSVQEALDTAFDMRGGSSSVLAIRKGGTALPML